MSFSDRRRQQWEGKVKIPEEIIGAVFVAGCPLPNSAKTLTGPQPPTLQQTPEGWDVTIIDVGSSVSVSRQSNGIIIITIIKKEICIVPFF